MPKADLIARLEALETEADPFRGGAVIIYQPGGGTIDLAAPAIAPALGARSCDVTAYLPDNGR